MSLGQSALALGTESYVLKVRILGPWELILLSTGLEHFVFRDGILCSQGQSALSSEKKSSDPRSGVLCP